MDNIGYLLMKVSKELKYILTKELKSHGLTAPQWAVLKRLELEEAMDSPLNRRTAVEISAILDLDKPTISGIINRLTEKGMLTKEPHPNDKRAAILFLTEEAKELIPTLEMVSNQVMDEALIKFTADEKKILMQLLNKMDRTLTKEEQP